MSCHRRQIVSVERPVSPPMGDAPVTTAGESTPSPAVPSSPWEMDPIEAEVFVPAFSDAELARVAAMVHKHALAQGDYADGGAP